MKFNFVEERILAVVAHPDDAELLCAGTLARAKKDGAAIGICVLCRGEKGQPSKPIKNLAATRRKEMQKAARLLEADLFLCESPDGTLADDRRSRLRLVEVYRQFEPTLVFAHAPEDYHPDHRAASALAEAASWFCASRGQKTRTGSMSASPAVWWMDTVNMMGFDAQFYIDISGHEDTKDEMLACHTSQLLRGSDGDFSPLSELMRMQYQTRGSQCGVPAAEAFRAHHSFKRARAW
jgi:LmbE family N-acetylglucosaminyl deacetylase